MVQDRAIVTMAD